MGTKLGVVRIGAYKGVFHLNNCQLMWCKISSVPNLRIVQKAVYKRGVNKLQCVKNVFFLFLTNEYPNIFAAQNPMNIFTNEYICLEILKDLQCKNSKKSTNECMNVRIYF